jgi:hypothetical protein
MRVDLERLEKMRAAWQTARRLNLLEDRAQYMIEEHHAHTFRNIGTGQKTGLFAHSPPA